MKARKLVAVLAAFVVVTASLAACGKAPEKTSSTEANQAMSLDQLVAAAKKEGTLTYYSNQVAAITDKQVSAFEKEYGVTVKVLSLTDSEIAARFTQEMQGGSSPADMFRGTSATPVPSAHPDWFLTLSPSIVPQLAKFPASAYHANAKSILESYRPLTVNYNTNLVPPDQVPTKWEDILKPQYAGKIAFPDPRNSTAWMGWVDAMTTAFGPQYLEKFAKLNPNLVKSGDPGSQLVAAGAAAISVPNSEVHIAAVKTAGAPIALAVPNDPVLEMGDDFSLPAGAPNPYAARLFLNFLLTPAGLSPICAAAKTASVGLPDVPGCAPLPPDLVNIRQTFTTAEQNELLKPLGLTVQ